MTDTLSQPGLRHRKKEQTRRRLMREAVRLFDQRGWTETTVEDIAAAADVSPRTFFRYFPTKVDVLFADQAERFGAIEQALDERAEDESVLAAVRRAVLGFVSEFIKDRELYVARARLVLQHPEIEGHALVRFARLEGIIAAAVAKELRLDPATDVRPRLVGAAAVAAIRSTSQTWVARGGRGDPRLIVNRSFDVLEQGFADGLGKRRR